MLNLTFDNQFTAQLPCDPETGSHQRQINQALFARVKPKPAIQPTLIHYSQEVAEMLGLSKAQCRSDEFVQTFSGSRTLSGMDPHATCYGGHQFGNWAGQLGDGRAINLGEVPLSQGHLMLQLKGAGPTPFSRGADGLAVLRSSLREYLCSEAMHHLGIPTTRALSLIATGEKVMRDILYDGHPAPEPGAVVCRVSSSFVRFGHFQMLAARQEKDLLRRFTDFVIRREFPLIVPEQSIGRDEYLAFFNEVCARTAELMVHWMRVGFVHGVMNTDNLSILGETIDYGPYGWLDDFDPEWTPNTTDATHRRYRYSQQPAIAQWNLMQLANALLPLIEDAKPLEEALTEFARSYQQHWQSMMASKLGLKRHNEALNNRLLALLSSCEIDMTLFYRGLSKVTAAATDPFAQLTNAYYDPADTQGKAREEMRDWLRQYLDEADRQQQDDQARQRLMNKTNPKYTLRNYLAQMAIDDAEAGNYEKVDTLLEILRRPYDEQTEYEEYAQKRPEWARNRTGCSMLSCSS
tara:strand:+ start:5961 stop:7523 length:1563 start_codon:yes stop_codon:yes gene_type:complete